MPKENVVSFRVNNDKFKALTEMLNRDKPVGCNSENQLVRKIIDDVLDGRLVYKNPSDQKADISFLGNK